MRRDTVPTVSAYARERACDRIAALATHGLDLVSFWREATVVIEPVVPHYLGACWYTIDPASLLITSHFNESMPELPPEWLEYEYYEDDVHKLAEVVSSADGVSTLHEATGGDPTSSPRWHANMELGGDQELIAGLRTISGAAWGALGLYREVGSAGVRRRRDRIRAHGLAVARGGREAGLAPRRGDRPGGA